MHFHCINVGCYNVLSCFPLLLTCEQYLRTNLSTSMRRNRLNEKLKLKLICIVKWSFNEKWNLCCVLYVLHCVSLCMLPPPAAACVGALMRCVHTQAAHNCGHSSLLSPGWFGSAGGSLVLWHRHVRQPLQALIGGMKYCRRKLKGPSVKIIHDMHISPSWWNRWYLY